MMLAPRDKNTIIAATWLPIVRSSSSATLFKASVGVHRVHVPSNFGRWLTIGLHEVGVPSPEQDPRAEVGVWIVDPAGNGYVLDGPDFKRTIEVTPVGRGDGNFMVYVRSRSGQYRLYATYSDWGQAREPSGKPLIPWNFWYFPYSSSSEGGADATAWAGTSLQPLQKYEQAFGRVGALEWEKQHHSDLHVTRDPADGHCDDASAASILFEEPPADGVDVNGVHFGCEELKLLATEVVARYKQVRAPWTLNRTFDKEDPLRAKKPSNKTAKEFGALLAGGIPGLVVALQNELRDAGRPFCMDLRENKGENPAAVWNHAVFRYETHLWHEDNADPSVMRGKTTLYANLDIDPEGAASTGSPARIVEFGGTLDVRMNKHVTRHLVYRFSFRDGWVDHLSDENLWDEVYCYVDVKDAKGNVFAKQRWTFAPSFAVVVTGLGSEPDPSPAASGNPFVDREDVLELLSLRALP